MYILLSHFNTHVSGILSIFNLLAHGMEDKPRK